MRLPGAGPGVVRRTLVEHARLGGECPMWNGVLVRIVADESPYCNLPPCPYCHGSGIGSKPRGEGYVCPWCGGTGERDEWRIQRRKEMMGDGE